MCRHGFTTLAFTIVLTSLVVGCGSSNPSVALVEGTVTYQGKPVEGADVSFWGKGAPQAGIGKTDAAGKFQISTFGKNDGALLGPHVVVVAKKASTEGITAADMAAGKKPAPITNQIPAKYSDMSQSPLRAEVASGPNKFDFKLED